MSSLLQTIIGFFKDNLQGNQAAGDPLPPGKLGDIANIIDKLSQVQLGTGNNGLADWLDEIDRVINDIALRDTIVVRALQLRAPRLAEALTLAGLIEVEFREQNPRAFAFRLAWNRLDDFLRKPGDTAIFTLLSRINDLQDLKVAQALSAMLLFSPGELLKMEYAQQGFAALPDPRDDGAVNLTDLIQDLVGSPAKIGLPIQPPLTLATIRQRAIDARNNPPASYLAIIGPDNNLGAHKLDGLGVELKLDKVSDFVSKSLDIGGGLRLVASSTDTGAQTYRLVMANGRFNPAAASGGDLEAALKWAPPGEVTVIGPADGTRLEIGPARFSLRFQKPVAADTPLFTVRIVVEKAALVFSTKPASLLASIASLPTEVRLQTDISIGYLENVGLLSHDGPGLPPLAVEFAVPVNIRVGGSAAGVSIERAVVRIEGKPDGQTLRARLIVRFGARAEFGPVRVLADGMGGWFGHWDGQVAGIEPPTGFGISLEAGPVSGGGFLARLPDGQFAGGLEVKVLGIGVAAYALFGEASGAPAFVAILGIRLPPPGVQIGFGFAITGVGGVVGINRRADTDVLREQLASGTSAQILFCDNPMKNGLTVIGQLPRMFPAAKGIFLIGPTFQISWLTLLRLDVGVFIELPGPRQIFIAGSARMIVGTEQVALVYLRMDFIGGIDLTKRLIYFDAALVNSHVMQVFNIFGGVALRLAYGDNGYFLFSVGGFHPSFNPGGLELPRLARAGTSMSVPAAWFKLELYLALTTGTFQIGAAVEAGVELGPIGAHGWFRFDAIVQYSPFYFTAKIDAGFDVEVFGESIYGVTVRGTMSGPGPIIVHAEASVKLLVVRVRGSATIRLGSGTGNQPPAITDVLTPLKPEVRKPSNVRSEGEDTSVLLQPAAVTTINNVPIVGAVGVLTWEQKRVPFGLDLQRFEGAPLDRVHHINLNLSSDQIFEQDWFGVGTFLTLSESEALNNARFTQAQSGIHVKLSEMVSGVAVPCDVSLDLVKLPKREKFAGLIALNYMNTALTTMQQERSNTPKPASGEARIGAQQEVWNAHDTKGGVIASGLSGTQAFMATRGGRGTAQPGTAKPLNIQGVF